MEDIEYLEEYRDLVLPALNSAAAAVVASTAPSETNKNLVNRQISNDGDDSSSSLDQDIFNCLFDDNSEDDEDIDYQNSDKKLIQEAEISKSNKINNFNTFDNTRNKITSTTKPKTFMTKTSGTIVPLNTTGPQTAFESKSVATVRPTVQNHKQQQNLHSQSNSLKTQLSPPKTSFIQRQSPSTSTASTSTLVGKPQPPPITFSNSSLIKQKTVASSGPIAGPFSTVDKKVLVKCSATIVRPEKIINKDPLNDPLELDNLSGSASENYSLSDISGETYNTISDFGEEDSDNEYYSGNDDYYDDEFDEDDVSNSAQVIELSNDSCGTPSILEDLRAPMPSPVISDDSDTCSNSCVTEIKKIKHTKPYSHPDIIKSILQKGEKPILTELLRKHNLLDEPVENYEGDTIVIDITTSRENLVESQQVASLNETLLQPTTTATQTTTTIDSVDINLTEDNKSLTLNLINTNPIKNSKRTNKRILIKKKVTNMDDCRNLNSPGAISTDSDLSAVEELLEESYANAMKKTENVDFCNQDLGVEMEIRGQKDIAVIEEKKQNLPKTDVVIDCDDARTDKQEIETKKENVTEVNVEQKEISTKQVAEKISDLKESKKLLQTETNIHFESNDAKTTKLPVSKVSLEHKTESVEINETKINKASEPKDSQELEKDNMEIKDTKTKKLSKSTDSLLHSKESSSSSSKNKEIVTDNILNTSPTEDQESTKLLESDKLDTSDSPDMRKKKRFRNLITPERSADIAKSIDDIKDFEGFEEIQTVESSENHEEKKIITKSIQETKKETLTARTVPEKDRPPESFKSPHHSLKDKTKEIREKTSRDSSKESRDNKSSKHASNKSSRDNSKDRSYKDNSGSRESSKDRSRESSKDHSKHNHDRDSMSKHHNKDYRKSSDSFKDSSKHRESSKSRDIKEIKHTKLDSHESSKKNQTPDTNKERSFGSKEKQEKLFKETDKHAKSIGRYKERESKNELKEYKSSTERKDCNSKTVEATQKPKEKYTPVKEHSDTSKSSSSSTNSSREPSKDRKSISKTQDSLKGNSETKKCKYSNNSKVHTTKSSSSTPNDKLKHSSVQENKKNDKSVQKSDNDNEASSSKTISKSATDAPAKKPISATTTGSKTSTSNLNISTSSSKSNESYKKDQQKATKVSDSECKKTVAVNKVTADLNKSIKSDDSNTAKKQLTKDSSSSKRSEVSSNPHTKGEKEDNKSKEKATDLKKTLETPTKSTKAPPTRTKIFENKNKEAQKFLISKPTTDTKKPDDELNSIKKKEDANHLNKMSTQKSEKSKTMEMKIEEKITAVEKTVPKDYKSTLEVKDVSKISQKTVETKLLQHDKKLLKNTEITEVSGNFMKEKANDEFTEKKLASNITSIELKTENTKNETNLNTEQKEIELEKNIKDKNELNKVPNVTDITTTKEKNQIKTSKDKIKESKSLVKSNVASTKPIKKPQKQVANRTEGNMGSLKSNKTAKLENTTLAVDSEIMKTTDTTKQQNSCVQPIVDYKSNQTSAAEIKDDNDVDNELISHEIKDTKENLKVKDVKQDEKIVKPSTFTKLKPGETEAKTVQRSESTQEPLKKYPFSIESKKKFCYTDDKLKKSVVVLIEPLKFPTPTVNIVNTENDVNENESKTTRGRINITKEENSKEKIAENIENRKTGLINENKIEEMVKTTSKEASSILKAEIKFSKDKIVENSEISTTSLLKEEIEKDKGKTSCVDTSTLPIEADSCKPVKARKRGVFGKEIEVARNKTFQESACDEENTSKKEKQEELELVKTKQLDLVQEESGEMEANQINMESKKTRKRGRDPIEDRTEKAFTQKEGKEDLLAIKAKRLRDVNIVKESSETLNIESAEPIKKTKRRNFIKTELNKEKSQTLHKEIVEKKIESTIEEEHSPQNQTDELETKTCKEKALESGKSSETMQIDFCNEKYTQKKQAEKRIESIKGRIRGNVREVPHTNPTPIKISEQKEKEHQLEQIETSTRGEIKKDIEMVASETLDIKSCDDKLLRQKESELPLEDKGGEKDPEKNKSNNEIQNQEADFKEKLEITDTDSSYENFSKQKEVKDHSKPTNDDNVPTQIESSDNKRRGDVKKETEKSIACQNKSDEMSESQSENKTDEFKNPDKEENLAKKTLNEKEMDEKCEKIKTGSCGEVEQTAEKEKTAVANIKCYGDNKLLKPKESEKALKLRRHGETKKEPGKSATYQSKSNNGKSFSQKEQSEIIHIDYLVEKSSEQKAVEEQPEQIRTTRSRSDPKKEPEKEKVEFSEKIETKSRKESIVKEKKEALQIALSDKKIGEPKEVDENVTTCEKIKETNIESAESLSDEKFSDHNQDEKNYEPIKTRKRGELKEGSGKEKTDTVRMELSEEKKSEQEDAQQSCESIKTRRRGGDEVETDKIKANIGQEKLKNLPEKDGQHCETKITRRRVDLKVEEGTEVNVTKPSELKNIESIKISPNDKVNTEKVISQTSHGNTQHQLEEQQTQSFENSKQLPTQSTNDNDSKVSTADEQEHKLKLSRNDAPQNENSKVELPTNNYIAKINSEINQNLLESFNLENQLTGSEILITPSNPDNTLRRILRKRGAESPFPENDNNKKTLKEPIVKSSTQTTPRTTKVEKISTHVQATGAKRLRSLPTEGENQNPVKKPKLETSKKSTLAQNPHNDCLNEIEISIANQNSLAKQGLDEEKLNVPAADISKTMQNKSCKEIKVSSVLEKKKENKVNDANIEQTPVREAQKAQVINESSKRHANQEGTNINVKSDVNVVQSSPSKELKSHQNKTKNVAKTGVVITQSRIKTNAGSIAVMSFSEWLKSKNDSTNVKLGDESPSATTYVSTPDVLKRQSRARTRVIPTTLDPKSIENNEDTTNVAKGSQEKSIIEHKVPTEQHVENIGESMNDTSQVFDNSQLLESSDNQSRNDEKQQRNPRKRGKAKGTTMKIKPSTIQPSATKRNTPTSPRRKEIEVLIESMSKEMKDGGITDLLKSETNIKRQRLISRKIIGDNYDQLKSSVSPIPSATTAITKETTLPAAVHAKVLNESENAEDVSKETNRSPTRRKVQQFLITSKRPPSKVTKSDASIGHSLLEGPKALTQRNRKFPNVKESPQQLSPSTGVEKLRKSLPITTKGSNVSARKSLVVYTQQQQQQQQELSETPKRNVFKTPKQISSSTVLNFIPGVADKKRSKNRLKLNVKERTLLRAFKCKKLRINLDRSVVLKYFNSIKKQKQQELAARGQLVSRDGSGMLATSANSLPIIQNNSHTNLRIQSVIDAYTIFNNKTTDSTVMTNTRDSFDQRTNTIPSAVILQDLNDAASMSQGSYNTTKRQEGLSAPLNNSIINISDVNEIIEPKNEFIEDDPMELMNDAILPDTPTLLARAQTITEAAQYALSKSVTPTDIRLVTTDSIENNFVPSFGVRPTVLDNKGTCMYTFLHPAKYNHNHSNVLLDYCCPNLNGPMPAIDPTRIHAQVQIPIIELPASIVLTTKVVTRADLESGNASVPAIIRKKAEKIRKNMATHQKLAVATSSASNTHQLSIAPTTTQPHLSATPRNELPENINVLTKQLPSTTTITPKARPVLPPPTQSPQILITKPQQQPSPSNIVPTVKPTIPKNSVVSIPPLPSLANAQYPSLRSNLRRFDVLLKQLIQSFDTLNFVDRHRVIEGVITSGNFMPKDVQQAITLMEEYIQQTLKIKNNPQTQTVTAATPQVLSTKRYISAPQTVPLTLPAAQMPQLQPSPKILASNASLATQLEQIPRNVIRKVQSGSKNANITSSITPSKVVVKQNQVPIYDIDRNIIGYQTRITTPMTTMPAFTKSTMSPVTGSIMSTATTLDSSNNKTRGFNISKRQIKRPAQDSPRVFYTTPPLKSSTPKAITKPQIYPNQQPSLNTNTLPRKTQDCIVTSVRPSGSSSSVGSGAMTSTTRATVKRVTRSTATGSKLILIANSSQSSEETILPDGNSGQQQTVIKNEKDIDFIG